MISEARIHAFKAQLRADAKQAAQDTSSSQWLRSEEWPQYTDGEVHIQLYEAFTDEELVEILREAADRLEERRPLTKKDVFCIYRIFILRRFGNWPKALTAAGLRPPERVLRAARLRRHRENERKSAMCKAHNKKADNLRTREDRHVPTNESASG